MSDALSRLRAHGVLSALDEQLARTLARLRSPCDPQVLLAIAVLSRHVVQGHVCLPLPQLARGEIGLGEQGLPEDFTWPALEAWLAALRASELCADTTGEAATPLVLDAEGRLYLRRHFVCERTLAAELHTRAAERPELQPPGLSRLVHYFTAERDDRQRQAAGLSLARGLCVISGGPGTGKTSTVAKILALAVEQALQAGARPPRIALVAPTGKAAARLQESIRAATQTLPCESEVRAAIPQSAMTIHRALRELAIDGGPGEADPRQLAIDLLLVDEASMVDLELMTRLLRAVPSQARVILLGDRDQLASVEAGAVLGDICEAAAEPASGLNGAVVALTRSYRYAADSGIGALASAIRAGDPQATLAVLDSGSHPDVALRDPVERRELTPGFEQALLEGYAPYLRACDDPARALGLFDRFRVLCAHRRGPHGVIALNRACTRVLREHGLIHGEGAHFVGRPLLITQNDYRNQLWNGDIGVITRDRDGTRAASFAGSEGHIRALGFGRLPPHESAFAMSVHKSQGSEVDEVALVLPPEPSPLLTRELLYTAITRARRRVVIHAKREIVARAVTHRVSRATGLQQLLSAAAER